MNEANQAAGKGAQGGGTPTQTGSLVAQLLYRTTDALGAEVPVRGLFVLLAPAVTPRDPTKFSLAFGNFTGVPMLVPATGNPWPYAVASEKDVAAAAAAAEAKKPKPKKPKPKKGEPKPPEPAPEPKPEKPSVCVVLDLPHDFVLIAHPSPDYARGLLANLKAGKSPDGSAAWDAAGAWPFQTLTPESDAKGIRFYMPEVPEPYLPKGAPAYGGWSLYYRMPYGYLPAVKEQTRKLVVQLGSLYYPSGVAAVTTKVKNKKVQVVPVNPPTLYPQSPELHEGGFDFAVAACLHRFQNDLAAGRAFRMDPEALASVEEAKPQQAELKLAWKRLFGRDFNTTAAGVAQVGMTDALTARYLDQWRADGLRMSGYHLVPLQARPKSGAMVMHANPLLWWRFWALEEVLKALGTVYALQLGNSHRNIYAEGVGQASASNHKVGRAFDFGFDQSWVEPAADMPVAYEADWHVKRGGVQPRWLLYIHSTLDPIATAPDALAAALGPELDAAMTRIETRIQESTGGTLAPGAAEMIAQTREVVEALKVLAAQPADAPNSTALGRDFFRREVRRFQWQGGQLDVGDAMPAITAERDGLQRGLSKPIRTFLNLSRLAYRIGLHWIGAQGGYAPVELKPGDTAVTMLVHPGSRDGRVAKAIELDKVAEGVERAITLGIQVSLRKPGADKKQPDVATLDAAGFDLTALRRWMTRTSDDADDLPPAQPAKAMVYPDNGVDLTVQVMLERGEGKDQQASFFKARGAIQAKVLHVGAGLDTQQTKITAGGSRSMSELGSDLQLLKNVPGESDHTLVLRPIFHAGQPDADPGTFTYTVPKLADHQKLEWWHLELPNDGKTWQEHAQDVGLANESISAPALPEPGGQGPAWQGGAGYTQVAYRNPEPENSPHPFEAPGPE